MVYCLADNVTSPLGATTEANYEALVGGQSALQRYEGRWHLAEPFVASLFSSEQETALATPGLTRFESLVVASARRAVAQSGIDVTTSRVALVIGSTKGNIDCLVDGEEPSQDYYMGDTAQHIAAALGMTTQPIVACNACISGVSAIVVAMRLLDAGYYDYAVVCGADVQSKFTVAGFQALKAVSAQPCRPFDMERLGLNLGEAAAAMVLCSHRVAPRDRALWAIEGGAVRNDAFHVSSPSKNGEGARLALCATRASEIADELACINAHGTATMFNDQMESVAIERAGLNAVPVNALKGYYGHTMGAAGVLETVMTMHAIDHATVLGTRGFEERGVSGKITLSPDHQPTARDSFVKMISGFGGSNAALLMSKTPKLQHAEQALPGFVVTHRVTMLPGSLTVDGKSVDVACDGGEWLTAVYKQCMGNYPKFYKMDMLSRLALVASDVLLQEEGGARFEPCDSRAVVLFNHSSSRQADCDFLATIARDDECFPSPSLFVYTLPNMAVAEVAMRNQYHGETSLYLLPGRDDDTMRHIVRASLLDAGTTSMITGWIDFEDNDHFVADLYIIEKRID